MADVLQNRLKDLIEPIVMASGYELWGIELFLQGRNTLLRVYIERAEDINGERKNISIDDCSKVSTEISAILDVEDLIASGYSLEVSSPGMDRRLFKLEQYKRYVGSIVGIRLLVPDMGRRNYTGKLLAVENEEVQLSVDNNTIVLPIGNVEKAHLIPEF